jgi:hypothetical protein
MLRRGARRGWPAGVARTSDEYPDDAECVIPFIGVHRCELCVENVERPGQGNADPAEEQRQPGLGFIAESGR